MRVALILAAVGLAVACSSDENAGPAGAAGTNRGSAGTSGAGGLPGGPGGAGTDNGGAAGHAGKLVTAGTSASGAAGSTRGGSGSASAGQPAASGARAGTGGSGGAGGGDAGASSGSAVCKRGIAANTTPGSAFLPGLGWWYNWSMKGSGSLEFVPMMWGKADVDKALPAGAEYLLTFNEPNFHAQSNLTAQAAADLWPSVEAAAQTAGVPIVSPAMNFCGPASDCNGTSPYQYLKDFFAACSGCQVDYVAVHWYNCDLASLRDYLEPGGSLEGFEQFGKPIWLTEFSCDGSASVADQEAYMRAAIPYLEQNPHVYRYSWFSADPIPNAKLVNDDGSPSALGDVYRTLAGACEP